MMNDEELKKERPQELNRMKSDYFSEEMRILP